MTGNLKYLLWRVARHTPATLAIASLGTLATLTAVQHLPQSYEAETTLLVETSNVTKDPKRPADSAITAAQLQQIEAQLMTKARLRTLIDSLDTEMTVEDLLSQISIETVSGRERATTVTVSVTDADGSFAAAAANALANEVIAEHRAMDARRIDAALQFFKHEVDTTKAALKQAFEELLEFKTDYAGALPEDAPRYLDQRKALLLRKPPAPIQTRRDPTRQRLINDLKSAEARLSSNHPRVKFLQAELTKSRPVPIMRPETTYDTAGEIARLDAALAVIPANSLRLEALQDEHQMAQSQYETAVERLESAAVEERIALLAEGPRITIVEAATPPALPAGPRQKVALAGGIALSAVLALLFAIFRARLDPILRRPRDLVESLKISPYAVIPAR